MAYAVLAPEVSPGRLNSKQTLPQPFTLLRPILPDADAPPALTERAAAL